MAEDQRRALAAEVREWGPLWLLWLLGFAALLATAFLPVGPQDGPGSAGCYAAPAGAPGPTPGPEGARHVPEPPDCGAG